VLNQSTSVVELSSPQALPTSLFALSNGLASS
jgi:hypothetical protein